jgi:hypothetical protein
MRDAAAWIEKLHMSPHPEGGFYVETYRSGHVLSTTSLPPAYDAPRPASTAICFLLESGDFSAFHKLRGDEVWHHYAGSSMTIHIISRDGTLARARLGSDPDAGQSPQALVPAGNWFAVSVDDPSSFALAGCTMAPGFAFADLELGSRQILLRAFPQHREWIEKFTRLDGGR